MLQELIERNDLPPGRALVPGAGSGYDVLSLASTDRTVVGVDLAEGAARRFASLSANHPHADQVEYRVEDLFAYRPEHPFDLVWDYTFLCALEPSMRVRWAQAMHRLAHEKRGEVIVLIFPVVPDADPSKGPPYPLTPELVTGLLADHFEPSSITPVARSAAGRQGKEVLGRYRRICPPQGPT